MRSVVVREYDSVTMLDDIEEFRKKTFTENNDSISHEKYNPNTIDGKTWCVYIDDKLASISVVERSHYTSDPDVAVRICRYHILKKYRHSHCGFMMLEQQIKWATANGFKIIYWTHNIHNKPLNAMYQHKRRMIDTDAKKFFESDWYKRVQLDTTRLFRVSENSDFLQYIYFIDLQDESYNWIPKSNTIRFEHNGDISGITNKEIILSAVQHR